MSDAIIFAFGCFVTLFVMLAVVLLMWGAANEPAPEETVRNRATAAPAHRAARAEHSARVPAASRAG